MNLYHPKKVMMMLQVAELLVQTLNREKGYKVVRSVMVYHVPVQYHVPNSQLCDGLLGTSE